MQPQEQGRYEKQTGLLCFPTFYCTCGRALKQQVFATKKPQSKRLRLETTILKGLEKRKLISGVVLKVLGLYKAWNWF
jgi:hypothetical protein